MTPSSVKQRDRGLSVERCKGPRERRAPIRKEGSRISSHPRLADGE